MKVLVTGVKGQLGYDVTRHLQKRNIPLKGVDVEDFDLTDAQAVQTALLAYAPDVVVHCAAYTAVDKAEDNRELCYQVNVLGTRAVARACRELDAKMIFISTDYVFDGQGQAFFQPDDPKHPINYYGLTKSQAEDEIRNTLEKYFIVRVSWLFGINGANFVKTMLRLGKERSDLNVVCDQIGSPTYSFDVARLLCDMLTTDRYGIYHATNEGVCSWAEFAQEIMMQAGLTAVVHPIPSEQFPSRAKRPANSRMSKNKLDDNGFARLPGWHDALKRYIGELKENDLL